MSWLSVSGRVSTVDAACKRGDFDADACIKLQDHLFEYVAPAAPWVPVGSAAQVAGVALALLALGLALLPWLWVPRRSSVCLTVAVPALAVLLIGVLTWNAELGREAVTVSGVVPAFLVWSFGLPIALAAAASTSRDDNTPQRTTRWRCHRVPHHHEHPAGGGHLHSDVPRLQVT